MTDKARVHEPQFRCVLMIGSTSYYISSRTKSLMKVALKDRDDYVIFELIGEDVPISSYIQGEIDPEHWRVLQEFAELYFDTVCYRRDTRRKQPRYSTTEE